MAKVHRNIMSIYDVAEKHSTSGQSSAAIHKDDKVHHYHHHSTSATAAHGYAAPTVASQLRMKLGGLPDSSPCQRYKPVEPFLPFCHKRGTNKTTTAVLSYSKGLTKKMSSENNVLKLSDRTVRLHPPNKTTSKERLSKCHHQGFHHPLQNNKLNNECENKQFSSTVPNSQLKVLNCDKGWKELKVPEVVKANNSRKISAARKPDEKGKEVLRGIPPKLNQTKRTVVKKTQSHATLDLCKTSSRKKDPLFEQMVEEEQHRWLTEVKNIEDKRKEFYCINENLCINFKVEWITYNIGADLFQTSAAVSTSQGLQNRTKDFAEKLDVEVNTEKLKDKKMNDEVICGPGVKSETSAVDGVIDGAYRLSCEETSVADADLLCYKEMLPAEADCNGGKRVEEAGTADFKVTSQQEGHAADGKLAEETLLLLSMELERNCIDRKSAAEAEPGFCDGDYDKGETIGQTSSLSADTFRLHGGDASEFEANNGQLVIGMSHAGSRTTDRFEVKLETEKLPEEANKVVLTGMKELLIRGPSVEAEIENVGNNVAREVSLGQAEEGNSFESNVKTFISNIISGCKASGETAVGDDVTENCLQQSDAAFEEGRSVMKEGGTGMDDSDARSTEEISLGKQQVIDYTTERMERERKEGEVNYVFELCYLVNERRNLDPDILQTQSENRSFETGDSELPVHLIEELEQNVSEDNMTSASLAKTETGSGCLSPEYMSYNNNQSLKHMHNSSEEDVSFQEAFHMSKGKLRQYQEDAAMQRCQEDPHLHKSESRGLDKNVRNEADLQMSYQRKSHATGSHDSKGLLGSESNVCSLLDSDGKELMDGFDKNLKKNLSSKENRNNLKKERAGDCDFPYDLEEDCGFNATVAVRDGASARHSTTVDVVCLDVGSGHDASVTPLSTLISDSVSA